MRCGRAWMITALALTLGSEPGGVAAQESVNLDSTESLQKCLSDSSPRYRVINVLLRAGKGDIVPNATLSAAAADGYRIVSAAPFSVASFGVGPFGGLTVLLESSHKPKIYEYVILTAKKPNKLAMQLDVAGAKGFRLHSRGLIPVIVKGNGRIAAVMGKPSGPPMHYRYRLLAGKKIPMLQIEMARASGQGEAVVGLIMGKETIAILEKRAKMKAGALAAPAAESARQERRSYLLLHTRRNSTLRKELERAAAAGYRIVNAPGLARTLLLPRTLLLEKEISSRDRPEYLLLATNRTSTMQNKLNAAAAKGFRLLPHTVRVQVPFYVVVERNTRSKTRYEYLVLDRPWWRHSALQRELMDLSQQGYEAVALSATPPRGFPWQSVHPRVFMERRADSRLPGTSGP